MTRHRLIARSAAICISMTAATVHAEPIYLAATADPGAPNTFSLDFGVFGGVSSASISRTDYALELDSEARTARFVDYRQEVAPLLLPGGISTGAIFVTITESGSGTVDESAGAFTTDDLYAVYFEGDLSAYQLKSPVLLPGASTGTVYFHDAESGTISMEWTGQGQLLNPFDPKNPIAFFYVCRVNTEFVVPGPGDVDGDVDVDLKDVALFQNCFSGADAAYAIDRCAMADYDHDGDVDLSDYPLVHQNATGPR